MAQPTRPGPPRAERNDRAILEAARAVFLADPQAPVAAVAAAAGVGMSALYRRYPSKDDLLRRLCRVGLDTYIDVAQRAAGVADDWEAFAQFAYEVVQADVHAITVRLAGTFPSTPDLAAQAARANALATDLFERARRSGRMRPGAVPGDLTFLLEGAAAIRLPDADRGTQLRRRFTRVFLDGISSATPGDLPGPPPAPGELNWRWRRQPT